MKIITVDYEHNCETWWDSAREEATGNPPSACVGLLGFGSDSITCSDEDAEEFLSWAEQIEGFDEEPFVIADVTRDDIEVLESAQVGEGSVNDNPNWVSKVRLPSGEIGWVAGPDGVSNCHISDWLEFVGKPAETREQAILIGC